MADRRSIASTCRLQLNADFGFERSQRIAPYLHALGVSAIYTSPIFAARAGSGHGYDVTDPTRLNPELGDEEQFRTLVNELRRLDMGLLIDLVPNHMAAHTENPWWRSMLEDGEASEHAIAFDVDWTGSDSDADVEPGRIVLPMLGAPLQEVIASGDLRPKVDERGFSIMLHDQDLPLDISTWPAILLDPDGGDVETPAQIDELIEAARLAPDRSRERASERATVKERALAILGRILNERGPARAFIEARLDALAGDAVRLGELLDRQAYRLEFWRDGLKIMNYRRFFDVSELAGVRAEDAEVFERMHRLALRLVREGIVDGVRLDHIDGLRDPWTYLHRLRERLDSDSPRGEDGHRPPIYVEKILCGDETLPQDWPVEGATGYEFLRDVGAVLVDPQGIVEMTDVYAEFTGEVRPFEPIEHAKKRLVLKSLFSRETEALAKALRAIAAEPPDAGNLTASQLEIAIIELTAHLPVYRTYIRGAAVTELDRSRIHEAAALAREGDTAPDDAALDFLLGAILNDDANSDRPHREARRDFVLRWQQLTGPAMAKGHEDTALYIYNPHLCVNDVGCDPSTPDISVDEWHRRIGARARRWPLAMTTTSTHDTKRGEDARARLGALSEFADEWSEILKTWRAINEKKLSTVNELPAPGSNQQILIYQTLLGVWPMDEAVDENFIRRVQRSMTKAAREAKVYTSWHNPDEEHEEALRGFLHDLITDTGPGGFVEAFLPFQRRVAFRGAVNSLSQTLLRIAAPGVPDLYQGSELWNLSMVDPDNRRPVDYELRRRLLDSITTDAESDPVALLRSVQKNWRDGRIKLLTTVRALHARRDHAALFTGGAYRPLQVQGERSAHVVSFARSLDTAWAVAVAPRLTRPLSPEGAFPLGADAWGDTTIELPEGAPTAWLNAVTGERCAIETAGAPSALKLADILANFPVALLISA
ncbi:MAG: malto-oligosyltrehalose synthase [Phycisphaeraceae bacterium]|nr:MAG: malto-oligosyltrehalose synthase [Phycisphaeraceae bacterium]